MHERAQDASPSGFSSGTEIGGYRIGARLGSGAMGAVYSAYDGGGSLVAIKFLHSHLDTDARGRERLRREAAALRRLRHPAIAQILDVEFDGPEAFIVTELVDGPTLEDEIAERGPLDAWDLYELADQLATALEAVHAAGVIHRDLKPSNVLVAERGPVLIDFGIAHGLDDPRVTATGLVMGTPGYLPPELLDGARPGPGTDWWGWAAMIAYAATGRAPFGVRPMEEVLARSRSGHPDLGGLGPVTAEALAGALRADPASRWDPARVVAALRRAADAGDSPAPTIVIGPPTNPTEVIAPTPPPTIAPLRRPVRDGRTIAAPVGGPPAGPPPPSVAPAPGPASPVAVSPAPPPGSRPPGDPQTPPGPPFAGPSFPDRQAPPPGAAIPAAQGRGYVRPTPRRRPGVLLSLAAVLVVVACLWPAVALTTCVVVAVLLRVVGVAVHALHTRRERSGAVGRDAWRVVVAAPWYVVRGIVGAVPSLLLGGVAATAIVLLGWWLLGLLDLVVGRTWVEQTILALAAVVMLTMVWAGPLTALTRYGAHTLVSRTVPGRAAGIVVVVVALVAAVLFLGLVVSGGPIDWAPLPEPPPLG